MNKGETEMGGFSNTVEYWSSEISATEKRLSFLVNQYDRNHMRQDWDFQRALTEISACEAEVENLYSKLDDAHRKDAGIYGVAA